MYVSSDENKNPDLKNYGLLLFQARTPIWFYLAFQED